MIGDVVLDILQLVNDQQQIDGIVLSVVLYEVWDDLVDNAEKLVVGFAVLHSDFVLTT